MVRDRPERLGCCYRHDGKPTVWHRIWSTAGDARLSRQSPGRDWFEPAACAAAGRYGGCSARPVGTAGVDRFLAFFLVWYRDRLYLEGGSPRLGGDGLPAHGPLDPAGVLGRGRSAGKRGADAGGRSVGDVFSHLPPPG